MGNDKWQCGHHHTTQLLQGREGGKLFPHNIKKSKPQGETIPSQQPRLLDCSCCWRGSCVKENIVSLQQHWVFLSCLFVFYNSNKTGTTKQVLGVGVECQQESVLDMKKEKTTNDECVVICMTMVQQKNTVPPLQTTILLHDDW